MSDFSGRPTQAVERGHLAYFTQENDLQFLVVEIGGEFVKDVCFLEFREMLVGLFCHSLH